VLHCIAFPVVSEWCQEEVVGVGPERFGLETYRVDVLPNPEMILVPSAPIWEVQREALAA